MQGCKKPKGCRGPDSDPKQKNLLVNLKYDYECPMRTAYGLINQGNITTILD